MVHDGEFCGRNWLPVRYAGVGQLRVDQEAAVLVGAAAGRPSACTAGHGHGDEPLAGRQRGARPGRRGVPVCARRRRRRPPPAGPTRIVAAAAQPAAAPPPSTSPPRPPPLAAVRVPSSMGPAPPAVPRRDGRRAARDNGGMAQLRIALAQVDTTVGDLAGNAETILSWSRRAAEPAPTWSLFPEMALTGYPSEDLVLRASFVEPSPRALGRAGPPARRRRARRARRGRRLPRPRRAGRPGRRRAAERRACCTAARSRPRYAKHHLPNYGVFDEFRYFVPGDRLAGRPGARRRRGAGDLRGPLAGRRPGRRSPRRAEVGLVGCINGSPVRAEQGRRAAGAGGRGGRPRPARTHRLREHGRRPGRAGLRRRLARRRRRTARCSPGPRSSPRSCWWSRPRPARRPRRPSTGPVRRA